MTGAPAGAGRRPLSPRRTSTLGNTWATKSAVGVDITVFASR
ncbi:MAG TPA: hypothetical protein VER39_04355 [Nocardioidaceae bacterium]|nr:hypothetical protein [Nocardioidaceae bacterium]